MLRDTPRHLFAPSTFRRYVWLAAVCAVLATPIPPFAAYYLKVGPQLATGQIMLFEVLRYAGVMVAAWVIRRRIDVTGARPYFMLALGLYAVLVILIRLLVRGPNLAANPWLAPLFDFVPVNVTHVNACPIIHSTPTNRISSNSPSPPS